MDESFIYERLKALSGGLERSEYRDISKAFAEVVRYNERALGELKQCLCEELRDVSERFYLYGGVTAAGDVPIVDDFLFPMDMEPEPGSIATVFCRCSRSRMGEIFGGSQELAVVTGEGEFEINAQVRPCQRYRKKIEELQNEFYNNGIYWRNPYLPYVNKFGDIFCEGFEPAGSIHSIRFKSDSLRDIPVFLGMVPLWNVEPISLKCTIFPIPAVDERDFRHVLRLPFPQDGYVVRRGQAVKNVYMDKDGLQIISEEKLQRDFDLYRVAVRRDINIPHYPLTSNRRQMRHIDRQADNAVSRIRTRAEIGRIVTSYEAAAGLEFVGIEEGGHGRIGGSGDRHRFIPRGREAFLLKFCAGEDSFLAEDQVSFLVAEVQDYYPQFWVTGDLFFGNGG